MPRSTFRSFRHRPRLVTTVMVIVIAATTLGVTAAAGAQAVTRAYGADSQMQRGMIVRISASNKTKVEALSEKASSKMEGVIVAANDAPVTLSSADTTKQQVFVANNGQYNLLVSNQNGVIKANDFVTISSLNGIGMKADAKQSTIVGKAVTGFDGKTDVSGTTSVKDSTGTTVTVAIGLIRADINVSHNPLANQSNSKIPGVSFLQNGASAVTGKTVDPARLYMSLVLLLVVAVVVGVLLYSGVRNGLVSIGRNPLAKKSITRGLLQVVLLCVIIFIIGIVGVYLILKL